MQYLLDTNICIYLLRGQPAHVFSRFAALEAGDVGMSCLTLAELQHGLTSELGADQGRIMAALAALLQDIPAVPFDAAAAQAFGVLANQAKLKRNQAIDNLIAAQAISLNAVLVTNNEKDFKNYPRLRVENWASAA